MAKRNGKGRIKFAPRKIQKRQDLNLNAGEIAPATPAAGPNSGNASEHEKNQTPLEQIAASETARNRGDKTAEQAAKESVDALTQAARAGHARTYGK